MAWYWVVLIIIGSLVLWLTVSALLYKQFFKRLYDIVLSFFAIIILSPLLLFLVAIGAIAMKGNPFFTQLRPGRKDKKTGKEKIFKLIKFRTMSNEKDVNGNLLSDEQRLNKYGKFLRATSLDELPELFNIFIGNMSIIGPRPQLVKDMLFMTNEQRRRHNVRQGLTGLAQCSGRNNMAWEEKFKYDLEYVSNITLWGDIKILFKTVFKVLKREGINEDGKATAEDYGDYLLHTGKITQEEYDFRQLQIKELRS